MPTSAFQDEDAMKSDLADYLCTEFQQQTDVPVNAEFGEISVGNGYRADVVVDLAGKRVLAVETKNSREVRKAIGQASVYRAHGIPGAVAVPGPLSSDLRTAVTDCGLWLFEYHGLNVHEHRGLESTYWAMVDRLERRLIENEMSELDPFVAAGVDKYDGVGWGLPGSNIVHADKKCVGPQAEKMDLHHVDQEPCKNCVADSSKNRM